MKISLTKSQIKDIKWVEWQTRKTRETTAHAVDPTSRERTGVLRALSGSMVPKTAVPAKRTTKKDPFDRRILEALAEMV